MLGLILKFVFEDYKISINIYKKNKIPLLCHYYLVGVIVFKMSMLQSIFVITIHKSKLLLIKKEQL